jgi:hypothetical protein
VADHCAAPKCSSRSAPDRPLATTNDIIHRAKTFSGTASTSYGSEGSGFEFPPSARRPLIPRADLLSNLADPHGSFMYRGSRTHNAQCQTSRIELILGPHGQHMDKQLPTDAEASG